MQSSVISKYERIDDDFIVLATERLEIREVGHPDGRENHSWFSFAFTQCSTVNLIGAVFAVTLNVLNRDDIKDSDKSKPSLEERELNASLDEIEKIRQALVRPLVKNFSKLMLLFCNLYSLEGANIRHCFFMGLEVN